MSKAQGIAQSANQGQFKNRIINGAMTIDQRNAGAAVAAPTDNYITDRWTVREVGGGVASAQQSSTAPAGFTKSLLLTVTTADASIAATDRYVLAQFIEGYNVADLGWGTVDAQAVTLSFRVRSSVTGTYGGAFKNENVNRAYPFTYTISSANTWTTVSVTIPGDTTGTWNTTNGTGISVRFGLGVGSTFSSTAGSWQAGDYLSVTGATNWISTSGATFYITGVQLEKGSTATSFDYRPYGTELALCQRYYFKRTSTGTNKTIGTLQVYDSTGAFGKIFDLPVTMRATPTASVSAVSDFRLSAANSAPVSFSTFGLGDTTVDCVAAGGLSGASGLSTGNASALVYANGNGWIAASAEL